MAHWKNYKGVGRRCVSEEGKLIKSSNCKGGKKVGKAKAAKKCKGSYHVKQYTVKAQNRKCPRKH
jgi:hypothetical protein